MSLSAAGRYPRYRAPAGDGEKLCVPPWSEAGKLLERNREAIPSRGGDLFGHSIAELTQAARSAVLDAATSYTRSYADVEVPSDPALPFVLTGHQPGFVHPGVWLKNFAAAGLAEDAGGVAISLVIDSDLCRDSSILVPAGDAANPRSEHVTFDAAATQIPWEERKLLDRGLWESFGTRTAEAIQPLAPEPLVRAWWPDAVDITGEQERLSRAVSQARHALELAWGNKSLEIPQSLVCQTAPFRQFATSLLAEAQQFREAHNHSLNDYRHEHRLRNRAQPVPDLVVEDGWIEAPFWLWSTADLSRRAVFVQPRPDQLLVSDRAGFTDALPHSGNGDTSAAVERLADWEMRGVKLRPRALATTMYARLFLADVFIHGIGGAKYDQVTDAICERLFGIRPPEHVTLTGTLRLPIPHVVDAPDRERRLRRTLRELTFHPERGLTDARLSAEDRRKVDQWTEQKRTWARTAKTSGSAAERHRQIVAANAALSAWTAPQREQIQRELAELDARRRASQLLDSREYAFCLFPRELLQIFLLDFSSRMS